MNHNQIHFVESVLDLLLTILIRKIVKIHLQEEGEGMVATFTFFKQLYNRRFLITVSNLKTAFTPSHPSTHFLDNFFDRTKS